jgi:hypothetical protein
MVFSLEHDIKVTKNHQNLLPTQSVLVAHTVLGSKVLAETPCICTEGTNKKKWENDKIFLTQSISKEKN